MKLLKYLLPGMLLLSVLQLAQAQVQTTLRLDAAYRLLEQRYPGLGDTLLIRQMQTAELELNDLARLPEIRLRADGRLQSTSTQLESDNPMFPLEINQPLVNLKTYLEADYLLLDGGYQAAKASLIQLERAVDRGELEVQRFALRKIINQLFLRIQGLRAQGELFALSLADIEARAVQLRVAINQGTVLESELSRLEVKKLELEAQQDNLAYQLEGAINSLSDWLGLTLPEDLILDFPDLSAMRLSDEIRRPELDQFEQQKALVLAQAEFFDIQLKPKLSVFAQAGIGYPNPLNILDNNIAPYGLLGAGLTWTIKDWDQAQKKKDLLSLKARRIDHAAETFTFRLEKQTANYQADMARLDQQIRRQESIVRLQQQLLTEVTAQMEAGTATSTDYILQLNAELAARQKIAILQTERQAIQLNYWNERGAF